MSTTDAIVSDFIVKTCRVKPKPNLNRMFHAWYSKAADRCTTTGSTSELYIEPMLPCIGDIDVMMSDNKILAVPSTADEHVPDNLPRNMFDNHVQVTTIIADIKFPSYGYLLEVGDLIKQSKKETYTFARITPSATQLIGETRVNSAPSYKRVPARVYHIPFKLLHIETFEIVDCIRCLSWPLQAADWSTRRRTYGWPNTKTIDYIVNNGCDLVHATHHQRSRYARQWRLSFSRAEIVLLNSWTPIQQIVYHILRVVVKNSGLCELCDENGDEILSRYHIKTLMMWTCELKHSDWWTRSNVINVSRHIMRSLLECCISKSCRGYFVANSNLLACNVSETLVSQLRSFTELTYLTEWMINNYIRQCAKRCPEHVEQYIFDDIGSNFKLLQATNKVVEWRNDTMIRDSFVDITNVSTHLHFLLMYKRVNVKNISLWRSDLDNADRRLHHLFIPLVQLNLLSSITKDGLDDILPILAALQANYDQDKLSLLQFNASELGLRRSLLRRSVEQLTTFHQVLSHDYQAMRAVVTTDIQAMYAYQCEHYQQCIELSEKNVDDLSYKRFRLSVPIFGGITHLMDDDLVSVSAIGLLHAEKYWTLDQLTISLYLLAKSKLKLQQENHVSSMRKLLIQLKTLGLFRLKIQYQMHDSDRLLLAFIYRKVYINYRNYKSQLKLRSTRLEPSSVD